MTSFAHIPIDKITPHSSNVRADTTATVEMVASIREHGIVQALTVAPATTGDGYTLIAGHRRLNGAVDAGLPGVPCVIREDLSTDALQVEAMLVENLHRTDLTPLEEAAGYEQLTFFGYKPDSIAKATGRSLTTVRSRLKLAGLPEPTRERISGGQITLEQADQLASFADDPKVVADLTAAAEKNDYTFGWKLEEAKRRRAAAEEKPKTLEKFKKANVKLATKSQISDKYRLELAGKVEAGTGKKVTTKNHTDCPGHRGYVDEHTGKAAYLCTDPKRYGHIGEYEYQRSQRAGDADTRSAINEGLNDAADTRFDFVVAALRACTIDDLRPVATGLLLAVTTIRGSNLDLHRLQWLAEALGMFTVDVDEDTDRFLASLGGLDESDAARLYLGNVICNALDQLTCRQYSDWQQVWGDDRAQRVIRWLLTHGYEPTDVELQVIRALIDPTACPDRDVPALEVAA